MCGPDRGGRKGTLPGRYRKAAFEGPEEGPVDLRDLYKCITPTEGSPSGPCPYGPDHKEPRTKRDRRPEQRGVLPTAIRILQQPLPVRRPLEADHRPRTPPQQDGPTGRPPEPDRERYEEQKPDWIWTRTETKRPRDHQSKKGPGQARETGGTYLKADGWQ